MYVLRATTAEYKLRDSVNSVSAQPVTNGGANKPVDVSAGQARRSGGHLEVHGGDAGGAGLRQRGLEYKQFDFWIGEWDVTAEGRKVGDSSIQRIVGGCVIYENYERPEGYLGKSFNFFDAHLGKWRQTWVDAGGNTSEFAGEYKDGATRIILKPKGDG